MTTPNPATIDTTSPEEFELIQAEEAHDRRRRATAEARDQYRDFLKDLRDQAATMKTRTPRAYWCPGPGQMLTAGQYTKAVNTVRHAHPDATFDRSFNSWYPMTAQDIIRYQVRPAIHERINARPYLETF